MGRELHGRGQPGSECSMGTEFQCGTPMKLRRLTATERCAKYYRLNCTPTNCRNSQLGPEDVLPQKVKTMWWSAQDLWNSDGTPGNGSTTKGGEDVPFLPQKPPGVARKNRGHCREEAQSSCGAPRRANRAFALGHLSHLVTISVFVRDQARTKRWSGISGLPSSFYESHLCPLFKNPRDTVVAGATVPLRSRWHL